MRFRDSLAPCLLIFGLLAQLSSAAQNGTTTTSPASCREFVNSVVPGACLGQFQHGTLVRTVRSGANEVLELASGSSGVLLTHPGVDLVADCGSPIYSLADGVVVNTIADSSGGK
jgi:murein DD-endopeptidase MepM/ murein hydrolase activator NlpD